MSISLFGNSEVRWHSLVQGRTSFVSASAFMGVEPVYSAVGNEILRLFGTSAPYTRYEDRGTNLLPPFQRVPCIRINGSGGDKPYWIRIESKISFIRLGILRPCLATVIALTGDEALSVVGNEKDRAEATSMNRAKPKANLGKSTLMRYILGPDQSLFVCLRARRFRNAKVASFNRACLWRALISLRLLARKEAAR